MVVPSAPLGGFHTVVRRRRHHINRAPLKPLDKPFSLCRIFSTLKSFAKNNLFQLHMRLIATQGPNDGSLIRLPNASDDSFL